MYDRPTIVSLVGNFLEPEMLHVFRQVRNVEVFENWVVTRRRQNPDRFPYDRVHQLRRCKSRLIDRIATRLGGAQKQVHPLEARQLAAFVENRDASLVHIYFGTVAARWIRYLRTETRPRIVSFHGVDVSSNLRDSALRKIDEHTDLLLCRSQTLADALVERGIAAEKIRLNRTGIPVPDPPKPSCECDPDSPLRVLQACRFIEKKGLDVTIEAIAGLRQENFDVRLTLAGDGPKLNALLTQVGELGLQDAISFPGFLNEAELSALMWQHDVFVHPSRITESGDREGVPNAILEAMAHNMPVIATRHSGIPEAVIHGESGLLIEKSSAPRLSEQLKTLAKDRELRLRFGKAGRAHVVREFSLDANRRNLEASYNEAIAMKTRA